MALTLFLFPLVMALVTLALPLRWLWAWMLPLTGVIHLGLVLQVLATGEPVTALENWLVLDALGKVVLLLISVLFLGRALYSPGYFALRPERSHHSICVYLLLALSMMTLVTLSHHLGLMWVALEATTLATAPCIYFIRTPRTLEATWKHLVLCSVGIAVALLGSFFLGYATLSVPEAMLVQLTEEQRHQPLLFGVLLAQAEGLSLPWLQAAFVLLLVGYGTKMGLAPMHSWKPDAYGESPGLTGALLAGGVTSCAFLAILRFFQICVAAGIGDFARELLLFLGLLSMAIGGIFMVRQRDIKRLLAYSSVEHMGILVVGIGIGGLAIYGALLHMINNGLTKGVLFLSAANIQRTYDSKSTSEVHGAIRVLPLSGTLFLLGFLALTGMPPFAPFISEFMIASGALGSGQFVVATLFLAILSFVFLAFGSTVLGVVQGEPSATATTSRFRDSLSTGAPIVLLMCLVVLLGVWIPPPLDQLLRDASALLTTPTGATP